MQYLLVFLSLLFSTTTIHANEEVIIYGDDDYPPYSYVEDGVFKGIYVEFLQQAVARLKPGYTVTLRPIPWKRGLHELEQGKTLALFPPYKISNRSYIQPYSAVLNHESVAIFCRQEVMQHTHLQFPDDFSGLKIGINLGFALSEKLQTAHRLGQITLVENKGNEKNLLALQAQNIDCYANDRSSVSFTQKQLNNSGRVRVGMLLREAALLEGQDAYIGYSSRYSWRDKAGFIQRMDTAIQATQRSGLMEQLLRKYTQ